VWLGGGGGGRGWAIASAGGSDGWAVCGCGGSSRYGEELLFVCGRWDLVVSLGDSEGISCWGLWGRGGGYVSLGAGRNHIRTHGGLAGVVIFDGGISDSGGGWGG